jgi:DNA excision repair protein ERCC-5
LNIFGIPYVKAPFEAEAQCAFLEQNGLVDGTVTEDSDALLFGCKKVYRYLFSRKNKPQEITMSQVAKEFGLVRQDLITMALFMGCDYTPGVKGIAAVNAIEIINCFGSSEEALKKFRKWISVES